MRPESIRARVVRVGVAWLTVAVVRVALSLLPLRLVRRLVDAAATRRPWLPLDAPTHTAHRVTRVARGVPGATCLTQALAARLLLAWHGHPHAVVRFGVRRVEAGVTAHAWVEYRGTVIVGGPDVSAYVPLEAPQSAHAR